MSLEYQLRKYSYNSLINTTHTIVHGLNSLDPSVFVLDSATNQTIIPDSVTVVDANTVQVVFFAARAIYGAVRE